MNKILLVDDENLILHSLSSTLSHDGSLVTAVANGKDALREIYGTTYDICFLDVNLPDANGLDLMKIMREVSPSTRIVIMTAADLNEGQFEYLRSNAGHYLPKPFALEEVRSLIKSIGVSHTKVAYDA